MKKSVTVYSCDSCDIAVRYEDYVTEPGLPDGWLKIGSRYVCQQHEVVVTYRHGDFSHVTVNPLGGEEQAGLLPQE